MTDTRWDGLTFAGTLPVGVLYAGTRHKTFTLRLPMAGDIIAAQEEHPDALVRLIALDLYRRQLLALGDIPREAITLELLREQLTEPDLHALEQADDALGKKFAPPSAADATGGASSTPLSNTATALTTSGA